MLVKSWKFRCQQQCCAKIHCAEVAGKPAAPLEDTKTTYACIVEADESMRIRMEGTPQTYHELYIQIMKTTLQGKESIREISTI